MPLHIRHIPMRDNNCKCMFSARLDVAKANKRVFVLLSQAASVQIASKMERCCQISRSLVAAMRAKLSGIDRGAVTRQGHGTWRPSYGAISKKWM